ncbi:unnamed protein product [Linum trigynum]|uniref:Uncharacterized protein n=1 Tax=Linum trigynum TaxID=586398 RepID=A0AAV2FD06_9ROSI
MVEDLDSERVGVDKEIDSHVLSYVEPPIHSFPSRLRGPQNSTNLSRSTDLSGMKTGRVEAIDRMGSEKIASARTAEGIVIGGWTKIEGDRYFQTVILPPEDQEDLVLLAYRV